MPCRVLRIARKIGADAIDPRFVCEPHTGQQRDRAEEQSPIDRREDDQRAGELNDRPPRVVEHREDQIRHAAGVFAEDRGDAAGLQFVDALQRQTGRRVRRRTCARETCTSFVIRVACQRPQRAEHFAEHRERHHRDRDGREEPIADRSADESSAECSARAACCRARCRRRVSCRTAGSGRRG